jgi:hypothetical protein
MHACMHVVDCMLTYAPVQSTQNVLDQALNQTLYPGDVTPVSQVNSTPNATKGERCPSHLSSGCVRSGCAADPAWGQSAVQQRSTPTHASCLGMQLLFPHINITERDLCPFLSHLGRLLPIHATRTRIGVLTAGVERRGHTRPTYTRPVTHPISRRPF